MIIKKYIYIVTIYTEYQNITLKLWLTLEKSKTTHHLITIGEVVDLWSG